MINKKLKLSARLLLIIITLIIGCFIFIRCPKKDTMDLNGIVNNYSYGLKYSLPVIIKKSISLEKEKFSNLDVFKEEFLKKYNEITQSSNIDSHANFTLNNNISINIYQKSWKSVWNVDLVFSSYKQMDNKYEIIVLFDMIYGPNENIHLERFQGNMAKEKIVALIKNTLKTF